MDNNSDEICPICLESIKENGVNMNFSNDITNMYNIYDIIYLNKNKDSIEEIPFITGCGHCFHKKCIKNTISNEHFSCPLCRKMISTCDIFKMKNLPLLLGNYSINICNSIVYRILNIKKSAKRSIFYKSIRDNKSIVNNFRNGKNIGIHETFLYSNNKISFYKLQMNCYKNQEICKHFLKIDYDYFDKKNEGLYYEEYYFFYSSGIAHQILVRMSVYNNITCKNIFYSNSLKFHSDLKIFSGNEITVYYNDSIGISRKLNYETLEDFSVFVKVDIFDIKDSFNKINYEYSY